MSIKRTNTRLIVDIARSLFNYGVLAIEEYSEFRNAVVALSSTPSPKRPIEDRFLTGPQVAEKLGISFSQFKQLLSQKKFSFKRHVVGKKCTRYLLSEVLLYMEQSSVVGDDESNGSTPMPYSEDEMPQGTQTENYRGATNEHHKHNEK